LHQIFHKKDDNNLFQNVTRRNFIYKTPLSPYLKHYLTHFYLNIGWQNFIAKGNLFIGGWKFMRENTKFAKYLQNSHQKF